MTLDTFQQRGWIAFEGDKDLLKWVKAARPMAIAAAQDEALRKQWLRCGGTWFVGVNALPNGADGAVSGVPLAGRAVDFSRALVGGDVAWDKAQVSVCYQGYPQPWDGESAAAFAYRKNRDAAHVDGVHRAGAANRRFVREFHQFVLGIPLNDSPAEAAPFVVWEGSHVIMRAAFQKALRNVAPQDWSGVDLTDVYQAARRVVFDTCARVEVAVKPGAAYVTHRHTLHGVAPWAEGVTGPDEGRMIAYFRPEDLGDIKTWMFGD